MATIEHNITDLNLDWVRGGTKDHRKATLVLTYTEGTDTHVWTVPEMFYAKIKEFMEQVRGTLDNSDIPGVPAGETPFNISMQREDEPA